MPAWELTRLVACSAPGSAADLRIIQQLCKDSIDRILTRLSHRQLDCSTHLSNVLVKYEEYGGVHTSRLLNMKWRTSKGSAEPLEAQLLIIVRAGTTHPCCMRYTATSRKPVA